MQTSIPRNATTPAPMIRPAIRAIQLLVSPATLASVLVGPTLRSAAALQLHRRRPLQRVVRQHGPSYVETASVKPTRLRDPVTRGRRIRRPVVLGTSSGRARGRARHS